MRILYINESPEVHERYLKGLIPSHWFYGAIEMEKEGNEVIWCQEKKDKLNDLRQIIKYRPDILFLPNLNITNHILVLLLSYLHIIKLPIYAYLHHEPSKKDGIKSRIIRISLNGLNHVFFLSEKTMDNTVNCGFLSSDKCSVPGWGADMEFYHEVKTSDDGYFVSTGKENRDFNILIEAFKITGVPLKIITARTHGTQNYENLELKCREIPNIDIIYTDDSSRSYPFILQAMAHSRAIVCPLLKDKLSYCVGLSSIADAEGLNKPLLITRNEYHSDIRTQSFNVVNSLDNWIEAIYHIKEPVSSQYSMQKAYLKMKKIMKL